jgi:hypothetical protein
MKLLYLFALKKKAPKFLKFQEKFRVSILPVSKGVPLSSIDVVLHFPANARINVSLKIAKAIALNFLKLIKILH